VLEAITQAVIAKRIIRQKENQIRRGGKCTPGNTQEIELNHCFNQNPPDHQSSAAIYFLESANVFQPRPWIVRVSQCIRSQWRQRLDYHPGSNASFDALS